MNYEEAMVQASIGRRVTNRKLKAKGQFVFARPEDTLDLEFILKVRSLPESVKNFLADEKQVPVETVKFTGYMCLWEGTDTIINGWQPTESDKVSITWEVLEDK